MPHPFAMLTFTAVDLVRSSNGGSGVAWVAHAAGFLLGVVLDRAEAD